MKIHKTFIQDYKEDKYSTINNKKILILTNSVSSQKALFFYWNIG
jgi:hypothetical protein